MPQVSRKQFARRTMLKLMSASGIAAMSPAGMAQEAAGLGGPPFTSARHMPQLPAIDRRSWKQNRGTSAPASSQAWRSV